MGSQVVRTVKGNKYLYYAYYGENKKRVEKYCGLASNTTSKRKALEFEVEYLKNQSKNYAQQAKNIEEKLNFFSKHS